MRKAFTLMMLLVCIQTFSQSYPVTGIIITLPANPDANTVKWSDGNSLLSITASSRLVNGRIDGRVTESKILVTIKKGGSKVCGVYTGSTAPSANFNSVAKSWAGNNAVSLLGKDCVLPPGDYELCVQFFGSGTAAVSPGAGPGTTTGAAGLSPLSEEKCRSFSIAEKEQQTYLPPQLVTPADATVFSEKEIKQPITLRWTPVIPRPRDPVTYRLKIWQLMQGQNGVQAMKANQPIVTKDVDNLTQTIINNLISGPCKPPYLCEFVWNVQALNKEGKPYGSNEGKSGTNQFSMSASNCSHTADINSIECLGYVNGIPQYKVCVTYKNTASPGCSNCTILLNSSNNYPAVGGGGVTIVSTNPSTVINSILPVVPATLTAGQQTTICFNATVAPGNSLKFQVHGTCNDASVSLAETDRNHENSIFDTLPKPCVCFPCKDKITLFGGAAASTLTYQNSGSVSVSSTVTHAPEKVIKVSAEIVDVERLGEAGCLRCTKESREFGNFTGGSLNNTAGTIVNDMNGYGKQIQWLSNNPTLINNFSYDLQMMFPPLTEVSCCQDSIRICTRWSFTDDKCVTCDTLICTVIKREYKKPTGPLLVAGVYKAQIVKMGEPFISWYNQENDELPADFKNQIEILQKNIPANTDKSENQDVEENMKMVFYSLRSLKSSGTDAVWNAINGNSTNSQCGNGDFETGALDASEWSGAYGSLSPSPAENSNPSFGTFTAGFSPASVGTNLAMNNALNRHSIVTYASDPIVGFNLKTTSSSGNTHAFRLGNSGVGARTEMISKKFIVGGNGIIKFMYALVLQDPGHGLSASNYQNPSFWVKVYDNAGNLITGKVYLEPSSTSPLDFLIASSTNPFFQTTTYNGSPLVYRDWTCAKIDLSQYIGQTVNVALINTDCAQGGHFGYTYIDDWCGNCGGSTSGSVNIAAITNNCIKQGTQVCVDYTLPKIGTTTGSGKVKLQFYNNGTPVPYSITSPTLTASGTYCFTIDPSQLPCTKPGYDVVATANFSITPAGGSPMPVIVTSPDPVGNFQGITTGFNNDLVCCTTPADNCCNGFVKKVTAVVSMLGNATTGYNTVQFKPTFIAGPKPIKQIRISVVNFESASSNKECLTCESNASRYGTMSVPQNLMGGGKDAIEGMVYPTTPFVVTCVGCPAGWRAFPSAEVTWGSQTGPGYNLTAGSGGDQATTFSISLPKRSTLSCCDDTIKICIKYSFTDVDCKTCDTIICYKVVNRATITTLTAANPFSISGPTLNKRYILTDLAPPKGDPLYLKTYVIRSKIVQAQKKVSYYPILFSNLRLGIKKEEPPVKLKTKSRVRNNIS